MKINNIACLLVMAFCFNLMVSCSSDNDNTPEEETPEVVVPEETPEVEEPIVETPEPVVEEPVVEEPVIEEVPDNTTTASLEERFSFAPNLVIENSYNTGGCDSPPCDTIDESLTNVFVNNIPDDPYFYLSEDQTELNLKCQLDKGRRIEFKQRSEGPLTSFSRLTMEGVYYDIPDNGVTIAQVHNRGGNSNKPFFRLVLHKNGLETVLRKDPEVSSSLTSFSKEDFSFNGGANYDGSSLTVIVEKSNGQVHISVTQNEVLILDESFSADTSTKWVTDSGIANGFYLKGGLYNDDGPHTKDLVVGYTKVIFESDDN